MTVPFPGIDLSIALVAPGGLPLLEAVWEVEARVTATQAFQRVHVVQPDDRASAPDPRCLLRSGDIILLDWNTAWFGIYDLLRIRGTGVHATPATWETTLAPNVHIGPLFCRALELYMSERLCWQEEDHVQAKALHEELTDVTKSLMNQSRSQRWIETTRAVRR